MKRSLQILSLFSLLSIVLAACGGDDAPVTPGAGSPGDGTDQVEFGVYVPEVRAGSTSTGTIGEFGVFCFQTLHYKWEDMQADITPDKMFNRRVERSGLNWIYNPPVSWGGVGGGNHSFFGYSPYARGKRDVTSNPNGNNITVLTTKTADGQEIPLKGAPMIGIELMPDVSNQVDLLYSNNNQDILPSTESVKMKFNHALSCIGFKIFSAVSGTAVKSIRITDIYAKGTLDLHSGVWNIDPDPSFTCTGKFTGYAGLDKDNALNISGPGGYFMLLPQDFSANTTNNVTITFTQSGNELTKTFPVRQNWLPGKRVIYTVDLGGTPSDDLTVVEIEIEDWKFEYGEDFQTGITQQLHFDANGGTAGTAPIDEKRLVGSYDPLPAATPEGTGDYKFVEWNAAADGSGTAYASGEKFRMPNSEFTLYARWGLEHTLTYDPGVGDASLMPTPEKRIAGTKNPLRQPALQTGQYIFDSWNTRADGQGTGYSGSNLFTMPDEEVTLYAQWTPATYNIFYMRNANDSDEETYADPNDYGYGTQATISYEMQNDGHTFKEWNTQPDETGTSYANNTIITITDYLLLYAIWQ